MTYSIKHNVPLEQSMPEVLKVENIIFVDFATHRAPLFLKARQPVAAGLVFIDGTVSMPSSEVCQNFGKEPSKRLCLRL